jgi:transcription elongation factor Elf1
MNKLILIATVLVFSLNFYGQEIKKPTAKTKVLVYYFHVTHRCNTCQSIEATTQKLLDTYYADELKNGTIIFQSFNCEVPENKALVDKYQAYGSTLALTPIVKGKEAGIDDETNFAFSKIHDESLFISELKSKIQEFLKP